MKKIFSPFVRGDVVYRYTLLMAERLLLIGRSQRKGKVGSVNCLGIKTV